MATPNELSRRPKVSHDQLKRIEGGSGDGIASTFDRNGVKDYVLVKRLIKAQRKAKKFVLFSDQLGRRVYVADDRKERLRKGETPLTFDKNNALRFIEGFDDGNAKKVYYRKIFYTSKLEFKTKTL